MLSFGPLGFTAPALLWALLVLPLLWIVLRAVPPHPLRQRFGAIALLLGLEDREKQADRTPWWLLFLRALAFAALIIGFSGPVLRPDPVVSSQRPLLLAFDATWADAPDWSARQLRAGEILSQAGQDGRMAAVIALSSPADAIQFQTADLALGRMKALQPAPWLGQDFAQWGAQLPQQDFDTVWFSDGLGGQAKTDFAKALLGKGDVQILEGGRDIYALAPAGFDQGLIHLQAARLVQDLGQGAAELKVIARGLDPAGVERDLAQEVMRFGPNDTLAGVSFDLPPELRNRITRFELADQRSAGAVSLGDDSLRRRKVGLVSSGAVNEGLQLLSAEHYLRQALAPIADLIEGPLEDMIQASADVIILSDVAFFAEEEEEALSQWLEKGGLLLRFAGPRLANAQGDAGLDDPFLPVPLRQGGRQVGGSLSWGEPKTLAPFGPQSLFYGLQVPADLQVREQVLAQPGPDLAGQSLAVLQDGTPFVTRRAAGQGQIVLLHVSASAEWSNLPLTGLFVQMLERLVQSAKSPPSEAAAEGQTEGPEARQIWQADQLLDAWGNLRKDEGQMGVLGADLSQAQREGPKASVAPGLYAGNQRLLAVNAIWKGMELQPSSWPEGVQITSLAASPALPLQGPILGLALAFLMVDIVASLSLSGRLLALILLGFVTGQKADAQEDRAIAATSGVVLAYVQTADQSLDEISHAGLVGLGNMLRYRTSIEPLEPMGIDLEADEIAFFPFLYWPITAQSPQPSAQAYGRLNQFLRSGGMILFDTKDGDLTLAGITTPESEALKRIASGLDIPPLEVLPPDHVLTRTFYLLQDFPGRYVGAPLWVEASPEPLDADESQPFRNANDGVTPVVIGGNDWAAAWAMDANGMSMLAVGQGAAGTQQREIAYRFGINLIMHVLTGNYKSDQVHVPALLERLGE